MKKFALSFIVLSVAFSVSARADFPADDLVVNCVAARSASDLQAQVNTVSVKSLSVSYKPEPSPNWEQFYYIDGTYEVNGQKYQITRGSAIARRMSNYYGGIETSLSVILQGPQGSNVYLSRHAVVDPVTFLPIATSYPLWNGLIINRKGPAKSTDRDPIAGNVNVDYPFLECAN